MTLTNLQTDALRVITELADRGEPPMTVTIADELDVTYDEAYDVCDFLRRQGYATTDQYGVLWYPQTRVELPPDDEFVGFFEDAKLVEEFAT